MRKQTVWEEKKRQYYDSLPKLHSCEENHYRQPCAQTYHVPDNAYDKRENYERAFVKRWNQSTSYNKNPTAVFRLADSPAFCSWTSSVSNMSLSPSQCHTHSSDRCRCSDPGSEIQEQDIWYETTGSENEFQKDDLREKNQKISVLLTNEEKQKNHIMDLEKRLKEAIYNTKEQTQLLCEERRQRLKAEENYARSLQNFRSMSNNLMSKNSVLRQKNQKLDEKNKMLKEKLQLTKDKLKYSAGLVREQNHRLSRWGHKFNAKSWEAVRNSELSGVEGHMKVNTHTRIVREGQSLGNLEALLPRDLLSWSKEQENQEQVHPNKLCDRQANYKHMRQIPYLRDKPPLQKIFEPGLKLLNTGFMNIEMTELTDSQSSTSDKDQPFNKEVAFWVLPGAPEVVDVEKVMTDLEEVPQGWRTNDSQTPRTWQPEALNLVVSSIHSYFSFTSSPAARINQKIRPYKILQS